MYYTYGKEYKKKDNKTNIIIIKYKIDNITKTDAIADATDEI